MPEEGTAGNADVKIRLVIDDSAASTVTQMKEAMHGTHGATEKAKDSAEGLAGAVAKGNIHAHLVEKGAHLIAEGFEQAFEMAVKFGEAAMEAADEMNLQVRAMSGLLTFMDRGQHGSAEIGAFAMNTREELEKTAIQAGLTMKEVTDMYESIIERGGVSANKARELTEQMATVGKIVPAGTRGIAEGFSMIELGVIRARNPIVQLIAATGTLHGNAHAVAAQLQKMTPEKQMEAARAAIERQYQIMQKGGAAAMTPSLGEINKSLGTIRESFLESVGTPMLAHLMPPLIKVRDFLASHSEDIKRIGEQIGTGFGEAIDVVSSVASNVYDAFHENWDTVKEVAEAASRPLHEAWEFILSHKDVIAHTFKEVASDIIGAAKWLVQATETVAKTMRSVYEFLTPILDTSRQRAGVSAAEEQARTAARGVTGEGEEAFSQAVEKFRKLATEAEATPESIERTIKSMQEWHAEFERQAAEAKAAADQGDTSNFTGYLNRAIQSHNEGSLMYAISLLQGSSAMQQALVEGSIKVEGGFGEFLKMLDEKSPELAEKLKTMAKGLTPSDIKGQGPSVNMFGGQTFNIKQDFREADPDRVMVVFRKDLVNQAMNRRQARNSTPFGL